MARLKRRPVEDFSAIFRALAVQREPVILVGGQAVNVWALSYQDRLGAALEPWQPLTSADMDLYATRQALLGLHETLGGKVLLSGPREITDGTLVLGVDPDTREIDVLRSVHGLPPLGIQDAIPLEVCGHRVPVLFAHLLLQAKLANARHLDQRGRQDIKHVKIMALVLREFLRDVVSTATAENQLPALRLLQRVQAILVGDDARAFTARHGIGFDSILPLAALRDSPLPKLAKFGQLELPRHRPNKPRRQIRPSTD